MSLTRVKLATHSHAALITSILEQSGHLSEFLEDVEFKHCCRYILYSFSETKNPDIVNAIMKSSEIHMRNITENAEPCITDSSWVGSVERNMIINDIKHIDKVWNSWEPKHEVGEMIKSSFDEIF